MWVGRFAAHRKLDAAFALVDGGIQADAPGQPIDMVDIEVIFGGNRADALQLLGGDLAGQQGHDMPRLALAVDPLLVIGLRHRRETHLLVQLVGREQDILEHG
ncbi:hypothetical protein D3C85_1476670 [compost metagenome]